MSRRLERSTTNKVVGGVCGGLGEYLQIDPTFVRVLFVIAGVLSAGLFILVYVVLLVLMPLPGQPAPLDGIVGGPSEQSASTEVGAEGAAPRNGSGERNRAAAAYVLIALGVIFLLGNVGIFRYVQWSYTWPLVLIGLGVLLLVQRSRR